MLTHRSAAPCAPRTAAYARAPECPLRTAVPTDAPSSNHVTANRRLFVGRNPRVSIRRLRHRPLRRRFGRNDFKNASRDTVPRSRSCRSCPAGSVGVRGEDVIARDVLRVTKIHADIGFRQQPRPEIEPLQTQDAVHRIGRRGELIPVDPESHIQRDDIAPSMPVIEEAEPVQGVRGDLVELDADAEIVKVRNGAPRAQADMRVDLKRRRELRDFRVRLTEPCRRSRRHRRRAPDPLGFAPP